MSQPAVHFPVMQKRPKLSLKTSELPISYGTSSRGLLTIATPTAATTPTTFNTFNNTYDLTHRPSPTTAIVSPISRSSSTHDHASRPQSPRPKPSDVAYSVKLPCRIRPILKNSPFPRVRNNSISASPRSSTRRVFFPAPKRVIFRNAIEEEIVNKVYTARHSDFFSSYGQSEEAKDSSKDHANSGNLDDSSVASCENTNEGSSISITSTVTRQKCDSDEIDNTSLESQPTTQLSSSPSEHKDHNDDSISVAATPASTRKRRKWEWTLAPLQQSQPTLTSDAEQTPSDPASPSSNEHNTQEIPKVKLHLHLPSLPTHPKPQFNTSTPTAPNPRPRPHSFDGSTAPRKRKADCLDILAASVDGALNLSVPSSNSKHEDGGSGDSEATKRDRAATL